MVDRPIIFSGPMVRAILAGRKTMTRRVCHVSPGAVRVMRSVESPGTFCSWDADGRLLDVDFRCPYGAPGDRLWVRETWAYYPDDDGPDIVLMADGGPERVERWRPSIFMPRWASRILLRVEAVRVERLQEISDDDIEREGAILERGPRGEFLSAFLGPNGKSQIFDSPRVLWSAGWDSINGKRPGCAWADNPWVWVVTFQRGEPAP